MTESDLGLEAYRALYLNGLDAVLFTAPDGRIFAANPAACALFKMAEAEICELGRQGMADPDDDRWDLLLIERERTGQTRVPLSLVGP